MSGAVDRGGRWLAARPWGARCVLAAAIVTVWVVTAAVTWFSVELLAGVPGRDELKRVGIMAQSTTLYDRNDRAVFTIFREQRIDVPLDRISPRLITAIIAVEDQRFYDHRGVDVIRVIGSALHNLQEGRRAQGGSTLTQQLARQSFLTLDKSYRRKLKEIIVAAELESRFTKDEILELYLNKMYFGAGLHGVEAASLGFFGKHASELTLAEAALLAGLVKSPSTWAPTVNLERAVARRNVVLDAMVDYGAITPEEADAARAEPVVLANALHRDDPYGAWFKEEVRRQLVARFGLERVYEGGLRVYTTIDMDMQAAAETAVRQALEDIEKRRSRRAPAGSADDEPLQGALVAIDAKTGEVRALVGGRSFERSHFNRATQARRQPGSAFKPFVFAVALEQGWTPASIVTRLDEPVETLQGAWIPEDEHAETAEMTLRTALRTSSNRAAVRLLDEVGIPPTVTYAKQLGVGDVPPVPSLALGSGEVTLIDLTAAYGAFANRGIHTQPRLIRRVEDRDGTVLFEAPADSRRVVSETTAFLLSSMLQDVIAYGTAWKARQAGFMLPAAGKTGTTNQYVDAWFVGYTPRLVAGVWIGFDQPKTIVPNGYASDVAVPLWGRFMKAATKNDRPEWYKPPAGLVGVTVCRVSGLLPNDGCGEVVVVNDDGEETRRSMLITDYFPRGRTPIGVCPLHEKRNIFEAIAGWFGGDRAPGATSEAGAPGRPPVEPVAEVDAAPPADDTPGAKKDEPKKKRGFWSRLFGIGKDDDRKNREDGKESPDDRSPDRRNRDRDRDDERD
ncbi:MAG TPA: PBP1A family penicillin-binding protein [Vicinamibacterales bacterium]